MSNSYTLSEDDASGLGYIGDYDAQPTAYERGRAHADMFCGAWGSTLPSSLRAMTDEDAVAWMYGEDDADGLEDSEYTPADGAEFCRGVIDRLAEMR